MYTRTDGMSRRGGGEYGQTEYRIQGVRGRTPNTGQSSDAWPRFTITIGGVGTSANEPCAAGRAGSPENDEQLRRFPRRSACGEASAISASRTWRSGNRRSARRFPPFGRARRPERSRGAACGAGSGADVPTPAVMTPSRGALSSEQRPTVPALRASGPVSPWGSRRHARVRSVPRLVAPSRAAPSPG